MLFELLLLSVIFVMVPVIYILFFTQTLDRVLLKLKLGKRADSLKSTAAVLDHSVRSTLVDLQKEKDAVEAALATASSLHGRPLPKPDLIERNYPFLIKLVDSDLYWSQTAGWGTMQEADRFAAVDKLIVTLPTGGRWYRPRKSPVTPKSGEN